MSDRTPRRYRDYERRADGLVRSKERLKNLATQAVRKLSGTASMRIDRVRDELILCIALVRSWIHGEYDGVSRQTIVAVTAALLYFVVPLDVIPDFLIGVGFIDDASVVGYVMTMLAAEMDTFRRWQEREVEREDKVAEADLGEEEIV
ncbi:MAG: YkvA family protein [Pseudomonadales bacterium]|nr:YkvA family protein [Pseudomonadales bacterium]